MPEISPPRAVRLLIDRVPYIGTYSTDVEVSWGTDEFEVADPEWTFTDQAGHFHAFDTFSSGFPTLDARTETIACDGTCGNDCEGYPVTRYACRICAEEITPKYRMVVKRFETSRVYSWSASVRGPFITPGKTVSVIVDEEELAPRFGIAVVTEAAIEGSEPAELELVGSGRLGFRPAEKSTKEGK